MRITLLNACLILGFLSESFSSLIAAANGVCANAVNHDLFQHGDHNPSGKVIGMRITVIFDTDYGTWKIQFADDAGIYAGITAFGWRVDIDHIIGKGEYIMDSYSSYNSASIPQGAVKKPENLDLVNWLVNEYSLGDTVDPGDDCPATELTWIEMQTAIRAIIVTEDAPNLYAMQCVVDYMVNEAYTKGENFEPCCADGEKMAVVLVSDNDDGDITNQVIVAEIELDQVANACPEYQAGSAKERPEISLAPRELYQAGGTQKRPEISPMTSPREILYLPTPTPTERLLVPTTTPREEYQARGTKDRPEIKLTTALTAGVLGDPHFKTWTGEMYDFHGVCDLVLLQNPGFKNGLGMIIHIRTKKVFQWSYISNAAIVIGDYESVEIMGTGKETKYWINGIEGKKFTSDEMDLPESIFEYKIHYRKVNSQQKEFVVHLENGREKIVIATWKNKMIRVDIVNGTEENFGGSLGLMGTFGKDSKKMARDHSTVIEDTAKFGQEWQVQANEEKIFHNIEGPQAPSQCDIPSKTAVRRRLGQSTVSKEAAEVACSKVQNTEEFNLCVFDVMISSDITVAGAY